MTTKYTRTLFFVNIFLANVKQNYHPENESVRIIIIINATTTVGARPFASSHSVRQSVFEISPLPNSIEIVKTRIKLWIGRALLYLLSWEVRIHNRVF